MYTGAESMEIYTFGIYSGKFPVANMPDLVYNTVVVRAER